MCDECWREFKGWCKSFTKTEIALVILEAILLILCIAFLIFLILHFIVCQKRYESGSVESHHITTTQLPPHTCYFASEGAVECTWQPFKKTEATRHYYLGGQHSGTTSPGPTTTRSPKIVLAWRPPTNRTDVDEMALDDQSDGEESDEEYKAAVLALVKVTRGRDYTFGCTLTALSREWTVTAASCLEAIEEVDSLDNFVMMEGYGGAGGRSVAVSDVRVHPLYRGVNRSHDAAALRAELPLRAAPPALPAPADYFLITLGERFTILGFGPFRTGGSSAAGSHGLRAVDVYTVPAALCAGPGGGGGEAEEGEGEAEWAVRHLSRGRAAAAGGCGAAALCAGVRYARGTPCGYCAGTPLLRGRTLLGLMADAGRCALACEPALYVNLALIRDWLDMLLHSD